MSFRDHNTLLPISRLPDCLLTDIFILVRDLELNRSSPPSCFRLSHVCRAWRNAAVQCALLWTNILFRPPEWTPLMLHRARTAPLTVKVPIYSRDIANDAFFNSLRLALSHIRHIRYLSISFVGAFYPLDDLFSPLKYDSADILEELQLSCIPGRPIHFHPPFKTAPKLRRSELSRCHTDWKLFYSIGDLTALVISDIPVPFRPSTDIILSVLRSMNRLERLVLDDALPELPESVRTLPPPEDIVPVRLENLLYFSLSGFVLDCANLMRQFVMPRCRQVHLETEARWPLREVALAVSPLSDITSSIFNDSNEQVARYYGTIEQQSDNEIEIQILDPSYWIDNLGYFVRVRLTWRPSHRETIMDTSPGFGRLLLALPLGQITRLTAIFSSKEEARIDSIEWLRVIHHLPHVETVQLTGGFAHNFVNAFLGAHASTSNGLDTAVLPNLDSLVIQHAHFSFPLGDNQLYSTLTRSLTRRQQLQLLIPKIVLLYCHITPQQLAALNRLTPESVECTGKPETWGVGELNDDSSDSDDSDDGDGDWL